MSLSELDSLQITLNASIDTIREELKAAGYPELSTLAAEPHPLDEVGELPTTRLYQAQTTAVAALSRLQSLVQNPFESIFQQIFSVYETASLEVAVKTGVVDALAAIADVRLGLHVRELQEKLDVDAGKLTVVLRLLATKGWFHETSEGVFAVTRPTLQLKRGLNGWKAFQTPGKPLVAAHLLDIFTHEKWKYSQSPKETAYQIAFNTDLSMFDHLYKDPEVATMFTHSVRSMGDEFSPGVVADYPWANLDGHTIVDCGGGQGSMTMLLLPRMPRSAFIIQDLPGPLALAKVNLETILAEAWRSGRITLQVHNFFDPQPQRGGDHVFVFRWVLHDWPDDQVVQILSHITKAGGKGCRILIIEFVVVPGSVKSEAGPPDELDEGGMIVPPFVPADFGQASAVVHDMGVHMMATFNAKERTLAEYEFLLRKSGMAVIKVYKLRSPLSVIEAEVV